MSRRLETMENISFYLHVKMELTLDERVPEFSDTLHIAKIYQEPFCKFILLYYNNSPITALWLQLF
jgi:hypothetical protein